MKISVTTFAAAALSLAALSAAPAASAQVPCAGLALDKLRAPAAPLTDSGGAVVASLKRIEPSAVLGVRRCEGSKYVVIWGDNGEARIERALVSVRSKGLRANDRIQVGASATRRLGSDEAKALKTAWLPQAKTSAQTDQCESASGTRRDEKDQLFGAMGLMSACPQTK